MNRKKMIKYIHKHEVENFSNLDQKEFDAYVSNLLEDFLNKCSDEELKEIIDSYKDEDDS